MATKMVRLTEDAYNALNDMKMNGESFSETVSRICKNRNARLLNLVGILTDEEGEELQRIVAEQRELSRKMTENRFERMWIDDIS
jgi:predicted CopG family antitoxin